MSSNLYLKNPHKVGRHRNDTMGIEVNIHAGTDEDGTLVYFYYHRGLWRTPVAYDSLGEEWQEVEKGSKD